MRASRPLSAQAEEVRLNSGFRLAQSLAFPTLVQVSARHYRRAAIMWLVLLFLVASYCWSGLVFSAAGLYGLLALVGSWWLGIAVDAYRLPLDQQAAPLPTLHLAGIATLILGFLLFCLAFKTVLFGFEIFRIPSRSMVPSLQPGHFVMVDSRPSFREKIALGDVLVFKYQNKFFIKRWVGAAGASVETNGRELKSGSYSRTYIDPFPEYRWRVPLGHYFMVGDNQRFSKDSRSFGAVAASQLVGVYRFTLNGAGANESR